jgi:hypothetical protein
MDIVLQYLVHNKLGDLFLDQPTEFHKESRYISANPEPERQAFFARPWATKDPAKTWVLLGTLAAFLQAKRISPAKIDAALAFHSNSANGSFVLYKNREGGATVFMKISTNPTDDRLECDSVILRAIHKNTGIIPRAKAHFSTPLMSSQVLVTRNVSNNAKVSYALEFNQLMTKYYGNTYNGVAAFPCFATTAAVPGFSLGAILDALRPGSNNGDRLMTFFQSGVPNHNAPGPYLSIMQRRLLRKLEEFTASMIHVGTKTYLAHGDLHTGNVLYDTYADALVAIDFGRSYIYTARDTALVQEEHAKIQSIVRPGSAVNGADFFKTFGSAYMRDPTNGNARMMQYNIMNDIAGLHFIVWSALRELPGPLFEALRVPFLDVQFGMGNEKYILVEANQQDGLGKYVSDDMAWPGLLWFAFMLRAFIKEGALGYAMYYDSDVDVVYYAIPYDQVFGDDTPFFFAGQVMPNAYDMITDTLQESLMDAGFFKAIQKWSEKVMNGGQTGGWLMTKWNVGIVYHDDKKRLTPRRVYTDKEIMDNYDEHRKAAMRNSIVNAKNKVPNKKRATVPTIPIHGLNEKLR